MKKSNLLKSIMLVSCMLLFFNCSEDEIQDAVDQVTDVGNSDDQDDDADGDDATDDQSDDDSTDDDSDNQGDDDSTDDDGDHDHDHDHGDGDSDDNQGDTDVDLISDDTTVYTKDENNQVTVTNFNVAIDMIDLGSQSIHNQIPIETSEGLKFDNLFNDNFLLIKDVFLHDLATINFFPIADAHLQQDLSAALAWEDGSALVRDNTVYVRSHEENLVETVSFDPATDKINLMYVSVRGDDELNFSVEQTNEGVRFFSPITGQSITLLDTTFDDLTSEHFEWRANQLEDNLAGRMGLSNKIDGFTIIDANVFSGKSIANAGGVDQAPYHAYNYEKYTGTPRSQTSSFEN